MPKQKISWKKRKTSTDHGYDFVLSPILSRKSDPSFTDLVTLGLFYRRRCLRSRQLTVSRLEKRFDPGNSGSHSLSLLRAQRYLRRKRLYLSFTLPNGLGKWYALVNNSRCSPRIFEPPSANLKRPAGISSALTQGSKHLSWRKVKSNRTLDRT